MLFSLFFVFALFESKHTPTLEYSIPYLWGNAYFQHWHVASNIVFFLTAELLYSVPGLTLVNSRTLEETALLRSIWRVKLRTIGFTSILYHSTLFRFFGIIDEWMLWVTITWEIITFGKPYTVYTHLVWKKEWRFICSLTNLLFIIFSKQIGFLLYFLLPIVVHFYCNRIRYELPDYNLHIFIGIVGTTTIIHLISCWNTSLASLHILFHVGIASVLYQLVKIHCLFIAKQMTRRGRSPLPENRSW